MVRYVSRFLLLVTVTAVTGMAFGDLCKASAQDPNNGDVLVGEIVDIVVVADGPPPAVIAFADVPSDLADKLAVGDVLGVFDDKGERVAALHVERIAEHGVPDEDNADDDEDVADGVTRISGSLQGVPTGDGAAESDPRRVLPGDRVALADRLGPTEVEPPLAELVVGSVMLVRVVDEKLVAIVEIPKDAPVAIGDVWFVLASDGDWVAEAEFAVKVEADAPAGLVRYAVRLTLRSSTDKVFSGDRLANRNRLDPLEAEPVRGTIAARVIRFEEDGEGWAAVLELAEDDAAEVEVGVALNGFRPEEPDVAVATLTVLYIADPGDAGSPRRIAGRIERLPDTQLTAPGALIFTNGDMLPESSGDDEGDDWGNDDGDDENRED